jgi:cathepsin B
VGMAFGRARGDAAESSPLVRPSASEDVERGRGRDRESARLCRSRTAKYGAAFVALAALAGVMIAGDKFPKELIPGSLAQRVARAMRDRAKDEGTRSQLSATNVFDDFCRAIDVKGACEDVTRARDGLKTVSDETFEALVHKAREMKKDESKLDGAAFLGAYDVVMTGVVHEPRTLVRLVPEWSTAGLGFSDTSASDDIAAKKLGVFVADIFPVLRRYPDWDMSDTNAIRYLTRHINEATLSGDESKWGDFMLSGATASLSKSEKGQKDSFGVLPPKELDRKLTLSPYASSNETHGAHPFDRKAVGLGRVKWDALKHSLPRHFDARDEYPKCARLIGTVRDQGKCGSCWAVAATEIMNDRLCISSGGKEVAELSPQFALSCYNSGAGCEGGDVVDTLTLAVAKGVPHGGMLDKGACLPYQFEPCDHPCMIPGTSPEACPATCADGSKFQLVYPKDLPYTCPPDDIACIAKEIKNRGSVAVTFGPVHEDFYGHKEGVYKVTESSGRKLGNHATKLIGWGVTQEGDHYWIMVNSWRNWGENGVGKVRMGEMSIESGVAAVEM